MKRANIKQFVIKNKKQIIFALFALLINYLSKSNEINCMVVVTSTTAAVTAGKAAAKAVAGEATKSAAIKKAAVEGAKVGAAKGAVEGANNADEDESKVASAFKGAAKGATAGAIKGGMSAFSNINMPNKNNDSLQKMKSMPKNNISSLNDNDGYNVSNLNNAMSSFGSKFKNSAQGFLSDRKKDTSDTAEDDKKKIFPFLAGGCILSLITMFPFAIVLLIIIEVMPISTTIGGLDINENENMQSDSKLSVFAEKAKNLFMYGSFSENDDIIVDKVEEVYNKMVKEHDVSISIPLLLSTLFSDAATMLDEYNEETKELEINSTLMGRLDYLEEVALLQTFEDYVVYKCSSKDVDGNLVYYKELAYNVSTDKASEGECNSTTVGKYLKEMSSGISDSETYYNKLKENKDLLIKIYGEDRVSTDELLDSLIEEIKLQKETFNLLYEDDEDEEAAGNLPLTLFYDENINFTSPLKGNYAMTSSFGNRTGIFAGMHKGIDMVSNDHNIYAAGDGVVSKIYTETEGGNVILITHTTTTGEQYISQYAHLSKFLVEAGETVKAGDIIGIMGDTGITSGVHLHFQVWKVNPYTLYNPKNVFTNLK